MNNIEHDGRFLSLIRDVSAYLESHLEYNENMLLESVPLKSKEKVFESPRLCGAPKTNLRHLEASLNNLDKTFQESLFHYINENNLDDVAIYTKAHIDRRNFSKIRSNKAYKPQKKTALCLCLALGLNLDETLDLLGKAGYTLSHASRSDIIIEYCIKNDMHDIDEINEILYEFHEPLLKL